MSTPGNDRTARKESDLALAEWLWVVRGGVAKAVILPDGSIKGMKLDGEGSLVEVWIRRPTK
jgi:hypothetical protein